MKRIVVVGAGLAGLHSAVALRERGFAGRLTIVGDEPHPPYDRPPLSKAVLAGALDDSTLPADWAALDVELRLGTRATALRGGAVETTAGAVPADGVVVATGARPVLLSGVREAGARTLRTIEDARSLRAELAPGRRLVIVGAGWIGAEVATAAATAGCAVTVLEMGPVPLAGAMPTEVGAATLPWWVEAGVDLRTSAVVRAVDSAGVQLVDGSTVPAHTVLVAVGVRAASEWLRGSGIPLGARGAVEVDGGLRTGVPGVVAVGDVAAWESARYRTRLRVQHWDVALHAPAAAAANLLGGCEVYDPVPYFWSEFGRTMQYAGHVPAGAELLWRGDPARDPTWAAFWLVAGVLVAAVAVDRPRDLVQARRLIAAAPPRTVDRRRLADPGVPVWQAAAP